MSGKFLPVFNRGLIIHKLHERDRITKEIQDFLYVIYLVNVCFLAEQGIPLPLGEERELFADQANLTRTSPYYGRRAREPNELLILEQGPLDTFLHEHQVIFGQIHDQGEK